jgi:hypothetical protein
MNDDRDFTRAGEVLKTLFDHIIPDQQTGYAGLISGWDQIAGSRLAMHVQPKDIINHSLILETDHPGWSQEVRMRQEGILRELQSRYPDLEIKKIRVTISDKKKRTDGLKKEMKNQIDGSILSSVSSDSVKDESPADFIDEEMPKSPEDKDFFELLDEMRRRGDS